MLPRRHRHAKTLSLLRLFPEIQRKGSATVGTRAPLPGLRIRAVGMGSAFGPPCPRSRVSIRRETALVVDERMRPADGITGGTAAPPPLFPELTGLAAF